MTQVKNRLHTYKFINGNARSVGPKIISLIDLLDEKEVTVGVLTETWLQSNGQLDEVRDKNCIGTIYRNRLDWREMVDSMAVLL